jgi:RNA polymerase sigma factor (sigma-70 family)
MSDHEQLLGELRPASFAIAYRMLGSASEAEDIVQEALLRLHGALEGGEEIKSPRAFLATVTTRLAIDELRSARACREQYVGEWLPEPIIIYSSEDPAQHAEMADSLSLAMLVLLESLSPEQRGFVAARRVRLRGRADRGDHWQERRQCSSTRAPSAAACRAGPPALPNHARAP